MAIDAEKNDFYFCRTVMIDDNPDDLKILAQTLHQAGIQCTLIKYEPDPSELGSLRYLRRSNIIFLDLHLLAGDGVGTDSSGSALAGPILNIFTDMEIESPYFLVIWTAFPSNAEAVVRTVFERLPANIARPVSISYLDKHDYEAPSGAADLLKKIFLLFNSHPEITAMMAWEGRVDGAAAKLHGRIFELTRTSATDYDRDKFSALLHAIAVSATGALAQENRASSMETGLLPLLEDQLAKETDDLAYKSVWNNTLMRAPSQIDESDQCKLNSCLLLEENTSGKLLPSSRGAWIVIDTPLDELAFTFFGDKIDELKMEAFINNPDEAGLHENKKRIRQQAQNESLIGLFTYMPPCDYAQRKTKLINVFLSALIPDSTKMAIKHGAAVYKSPVIWYAGKGHMILANFKFVSSVPEQFLETIRIKAAPPLFRIRDQLLNEIAVKYAAYMTRPGIISIPEKINAVNE